ncbi:sensor histidine kinase KdpD [Sphingobium aquiterrae]|uniref:sensor histidine kinase KdpD n=1 Tax=Sphingobium aquiterrae TaxID=2038656 RepID=UPI00301AE2EB
MNAPSDRPQPEAFLRAAAQEGRGRLKVFLGAAPGVGKTYEMLSEGMARLRAGVDVVIAVVETHGRAETESLTQGHEIIPRRAIDYQGRVLEEMDIDAILARHPALALVDELAHTNAPGSRHPKRWQDVQELLAAGIDVFSTVNIQHLESLNDVVASFTRVRVRETVPDKVLEEAEIEVVDIPPDELIERLKEGKVYVPHEATRALGHFFAKSNLSALRELALRRAAQAVDSQMLDYLRQHALAGTWAGGERVLVAVSEHPGCEALVRAAKRIADALRAPWTVLHVETARDADFGDDERRQLAKILNLASQLGGAVMSLPAQTVLAGIKTCAADMRATQILVGKSSRSRWFELRHGSVVDRLVRETPGVAVHVFPMDAEGVPRGRRSAPRDWGQASHYAWTLAMVAAVTGIASTLFHILNLGNVALLYLLPVMVAASTFSLRAGLFAGIASSLAYNFFFLPPTGTLTVNNPENVVTIVVLLGVAFATSQLAARVRGQADLAASSARQNAAQAGFLRQLNAAGTDEEVMQTICAEIARLLDVRTVLITPSAHGPELRAAMPPEDRLDALARAAVDWTLERGQSAGRGSDTLTASDWLFHPLATPARTLGALGVARDDGRDPLRSDQLPLFMSLLDQATLVLERMRLEDEMRDVAQLKERDRLRAALLSSVSHDLRTPITAISTAASQLSGEGDMALAGTIQTEVARLNRFVANLLDMARVEAGALTLAVEPTDLTDAIASAVHDTRATLEGHAIDLDVSPGLPLVRVDPRLLHHILINLLDNAGRYADPGTAIAIAASRQPGALILSVIDHGPGLPPGSESRIFDSFKRIEGSDRTKGGTGLGLAIVKGFADAMGIGVEARSRLDDSGAVFSLRFPETLLVRQMEAGTLT